MGKAPTENGLARQELAGLRAAFEACKANRDDDIPDITKRLTNVEKVLGTMREEQAFRRGRTALWSMIGAFLGTLPAAVTLLTKALGMW